MEQLRYPTIKTEFLGDTTTLLQQPSLDLDLEGFLSAQGLAQDDWLAPNGALLDPSAYATLPLPPSPAVPPLPFPGPCSPKTSISSGSAGTDCVGTGGSHNGDSPLDSTENAPSAEPLPSLARTSGGRSKSTAGKRRKVRPKEKLDSLQKQLDSIMQQVQALTLVNQDLHRKNHVLSTLLQCSERVEQLSSDALQQHEAYLQNPAAPLDSSSFAATMHKLTAAEYLAAYNAFLAEASRWVIQAGELDEALSEEADSQLRDINQRLLDYLTASSTLRPGLMAQIKQMVWKQFNPKTSEEEHWLGILHTLQLTPEQEARMLLTRDIFLRTVGRLEQERIGLGDALNSGCSPAAMTCTTCVDNELLLERVMLNLMKCRNLAMVVGHWLYTHTFTPLQTAKAALHSHPVMPCPLMMLNILALDVERRSSRSQTDPVGWLASQQQAGLHWQTSTHFTAAVS